MVAAMNSLEGGCTAASLRRSGGGSPNSGGGGARPAVLDRFGTYGTIVLVFAFASLLGLAILLGALVVTVAVLAVLLAAALICRLPLAGRRLR
jgi:hypothetical protein